MVLKLAKLAMEQKNLASDFFKLAALIFKELK
jgi:hypothetical protein